MTLRPKQKRFVEEYLSDPKAAPAELYQRAGYLAVGEVAAKKASALLASQKIKDAIAMNRVARAAGRPSIFTDEIADQILERLAAGESLVAICADEGLPSVRTVLRWADEREEFGTEYARAREAQGEYMDDLILNAASRAIVDPQASKVQIEAYKWRAAKLAPKRYGDSTTVKHADADGEKLPLDEVAKFTRLAAIAAQARESLEGGDELADDAS